MIKDSRILGNVTSGSTIEMNAHSVVDGDIKGQDLSIDGKCKGNIYAEGLLHLMMNAKGKGDLFVEKLQIDEGVQVDGSINMTKKKKG